MKFIHFSLLVLASFNANAQDCIPFSDISKVLYENIKNENVYYCQALKLGEKRYINGDVKNYLGIISNVDSEKQEASLKIDPPSWLKDSSNYNETRTLPCSQFFSDSEKLNITSGDPKIAEGKAKVSKMIGKQCHFDN